MRPQHRSSTRQVINRSYSDDLKIQQSHLEATKKDSSNSVDSSDAEVVRQDKFSLIAEPDTPTDTPALTVTRTRSFPLIHFPINNPSLIFRKISREGSWSGCKLLEETEDGLNQPFNNAEVLLEFPKDTFKRREITRYLRERHVRRQGFSSDDSEAIVKLLKSWK